MTYSEPHYLLAWGGSLGPDEEWSMTLRLSDGFQLQTKEQEEAALQSLRTAIQSWWSTGISGARARLKWVKLNRIGTDGRYVKDYTNLHEFTSDIVSTGTSTHPNQVALVATLETGATRGLAHRGRMFFPVPTAPVDITTGQVSAANTQAAANKVKTLIDNLHAAGGGLRVHVYSGTREGANREVTGVTVGSVLDTMRSRRAQLEEVRSAAAIAAGP